MKIATGKRGHRGGRAGWSLLEIMVALAILGFGVIGATTGQILSMKLSTTLPSLTPQRGHFMGGSFSADQ